MQQVSSMNTSINTKKLPAIWKKLNIPQDTHWLVDYGAGRPETRNLIIQYLDYYSGLNKSPSYIPYDPYWGDTYLNEFALHLLNRIQDVDLCICANVLNVVDDETIRNIIKEVTKAKKWVFQIYEGDKSGEGKITKPNCFQQNKRTKEYLWIFNELGVKEVAIKGNFITNNLNLIK